MKKNKVKKKRSINVFKNLKLKWKLYFSFYIVIPIFLISGLFIIQNINKVNDGMIMIEESMETQQHILRASVLLSAQSEKLDENHAMPDSTKLHSIKQSHTQITNSIENIKVKSEDDKGSLEIIHMTLNDIKEKIEGVKKADELNKDYRAIKNKYDFISVEFRVISDSVFKLAKEKELESQKIIETTKTELIVTLIIITVIVIISAVVLVRIITKPILEITEVTKEIAKGNLRVKKMDVDSKDEIGQLTASVNIMNENLKGLIHKTNEIVAEVVSSSEELSTSIGQTTKATEHIATTISEVAEGTEEQVQKANETVMVVSDISSGISQISNNIRTVSNSSDQVGNTVMNGNEYIKENVNKMNEINEKTEGMAKIVNDLASQSEEIGNIVGMITEISSQTNLLALNANIEAARAGEHGKGFAVVANEVKKLAEESAGSANRINGIIEEMQSKVKEAISEVHSNSKSVSEGTEITKKTGVAFEEINNAIEKIREEILQVTKGTEEIESSTTSMVNSVNNLEEVSKTNNSHTQTIASNSEEQTASMQEITASSERLATLAEDLKKEIDKFEI